MRLLALVGLLATSSSGASEQAEVCVEAYNQCGGASNDFDGPQCCPPGFACVKLHPVYSMCMPLHDDWEAAVGLAEAFDEDEDDWELGAEENDALGEAEEPEEDEEKTETETENGDAELQGAAPHKLRARSRMLQSVSSTCTVQLCGNDTGDIDALIKVKGVGAYLNTSCQSGGMGCGTGGHTNCKTCLYDVAMATAAGYPRYDDCPACLKSMYCANNVAYPGCASVTPAPTVKATAKPTSKPVTSAPSQKPTRTPTLKPGTTAKPTSKPTIKPTVKPTTKPTSVPTRLPTSAPTTAVVSAESNPVVIGDGTLAYVSAYSITLTGMVVAWNSAASASPTYNVYVNGAVTGSTTSTSYTLTGLTAGTTYKIQVKVTSTTESSRVLTVTTLGQAYSARESAVASAMATMTLAEKVEQCHGSPNNPIDYQYFITPTNSRLSIPGFTMRDGTHGVRGGMLWPTGVGCAATFNPDLEEKIGQGIGNDHRGLGDDVGLGPGMDIFRDLRWGRGFESYGEDPFLSGKMAAAKVRGMQTAKCIPTIKHFVCNNIETGRGGYTPTVPERTMHEIYALPFEMAVKEGGALAFMSAYSGVNGTAMTANTALQQYMVKDLWGFQGMIVSDWGAAYNTVPDALAGMDVEMPGDGIFGASLLSAIQAGTVPQYMLDDKVRRILRVKHFLGSLGNAAYTAKLSAQFNAWLGATEMAVIKQAGQEAIVLAKNSGMLPLSKTAVRKVALVGPDEFVNKIREGGMGSSFMSVCPTNPFPLTPSQAVKSKCSSCTFVTDWTQADEIIAILGVYDAGEGYDKSGTGLMQLVELNVPGVPLRGCSIDQDALISSIMATNKKASTTVVLTGGSAAVKGTWADAAAVVVALYPGNEQGSGIADVLFGDYNPAGRLPVTYPMSAADIPAWGATATYEDAQEGRGWTYYEKHNIPVLYPFGHGLSYTTFTYSNLVIPATVKRGAGGLVVKVTITNAGSRNGDEVVQLYVSQRNPSVPRRVKDLRGFDRVNIPAGTAVTVSLPLADRDLAYWSVTASDWVADLDTYDVMVGASSKDIKLTGSFTLVA